MKTNEQTLWLAIQNLLDASYLDERPDPPPALVAARQHARHTIDRVVPRAAVDLPPLGWDLSPMEREVFEFANERWPRRDLPGRVRKLGEEFGELAEAVARYLSRSIGGDEALYEARSNVLKEAADCGIVLDDLCAILKASLHQAKVRKMHENQRREDVTDTKAKGGTR